MAALVPPGVVTTTLAVPAVPAGVVTVMDVELFTTTLVAAVPPIVTAVAPVKSVPIMVMLVPPATGPLVGVILVTVGAATTVATWTAVPLLAPLVVTTAVRLPAVLRGVRVTVNEVDVALEIVPTAPLLKVTVLLANVVSNPVPLMVSVVAPSARLAVFKVMVGLTVATWTAVPLLAPLVVTTAVRLPAVLRGVKVTVNEVDVALEIVPTAPLLNETVLLPAVVSNPVPLMVSVVAPSARLAVLKVMVGAKVNNVLAVLVPPSVVTTTLAVPTAWAGVVTVIEVGLFRTRLVAATPSMVTTVSPVKSVPIMVMLVPPAIGPLVGVILVTVGAAA